MTVLPRTFAEAVAFFADPDTCRRYLRARRWPEGLKCPVCGSRWVYRDNQRNGWECRTRHPKRKFTLKSGTLFHQSPIGLHLWLPAIWVVANVGASPMTIRRTIGAKYRTAWFMALRIRLAMRDEDGR